MISDIELKSRLANVEFSLKQLRISIRKIAGTHVSKIEIKEKSQSIALMWFHEIEADVSKILGLRFDESKYHTLFERLLEVSTAKTARKNTYLDIIDSIIADFKKEIFLPVMKSRTEIDKMSQLDKILENTTASEREYLEEAVGCANHGFYRGSIVLGWSAAVSRLHNKVVQLGLDEFNKKSAEMKNIKTGRYKKFDKSFCVQTPNDLESTVFDNDLLWILEYWGLIDSNQHDRLQICFTMRNNSAHPGEAKITPENLVSFFSDLKTMVFDNSNLKLKIP